jgi:class 3 adenylate cyclase
MEHSGRSGWIVCALTLAMLAGGAALLIATWVTPLAPGLVPRAAVLFAAPVFSIAGATIASRVPNNAIGRVFLLAGFLGAIQLLSEQTVYAAETWPTLVPLAPWAAFAFWVIGTINSLGFALYVIGLFPSGRFSTRREKQAVRVGTVASLWILAAAVTMTERFPAPLTKYANPLAHTELAGVATPLWGLATLVYVAALGVVVVGMVRRYRRSIGVEHQQLKWFAYAGALAAATLAVLYGTVALVFFTSGQATLDAPPIELRLAVVASVGAFIFWPFAVAQAILRHRLYDIDILINRTVLYVSVTAILAAVFAVLSTVSQRAVEALTGQRSELLTISLALAVALGFAPLRRRVQPLVDQLLPGRGLLTLLFTDIVGSTERVVALGDERWRTVLEAYRAAVRRDLARFGGREIDTAGDGFFATFERPTQGVRCAVALRDALHALGLESRVGLHIGECELRGEKVSGINVIVAARIMATAGANEIVVSRELRDLLASTDFGFRDRGIESLKGVPGEWPLSSVEAGLAPA